MPEKYDIGPRITIDGEAEYKRQMQDLVKVTKTLTAEGKRLAAEYEDNADSIEAVTAKTDFYNRQLDVQSKKISLTEEQIKKASDAYDKAAKVTEEWKEKLEDAQKELDDLKNSSTATEDAVQAQQKAVNSIKSAYIGAESRTRIFGNKLQDLKTDLEKARTAQIQAGRALKQMTQDTEQSSNSVEKYSDSIDKSKGNTSSFGDTAKQVFHLLGIDVDDAIDVVTAAFDDYEKKVTETGDATTETKDKTLDATDLMSGALGGAVMDAAIKLAGKIIEIGKNAQEAAEEVEYATDRMQVALGLSEEEAKRLAENINNVFKSGIVDNRQDAVDAVSTLVQMLGVTGEEAEHLAYHLITVRDAFGGDFAETARTADTLMKNFKISSEEAFDIITTGYTNGLDKSGDFLDTLNEYSAVFAGQGQTAQEFLSRLNAGIEAGAYNTDMLGDVMETLWDNANTGSDEFKEALKALHLPAEAITRDLTAGGEQSAKAVDKINEKLNKVGDSSKAAKIGATLFGSQFAKIRGDAILALTETDVKLLDTAGNADRAVGNLMSNVKTVRQAVKNETDAALSDFMNSLPDTNGTRVAHYERIQQEIGQKWGNANIEGQSSAIAAGQERVSTAQQEINDRLMAQMEIGLREMGVSAADIPQIMASAISSTGGVVTEETVALVKQAAAASNAQAAQNGTAYSESFAGGIRDGSDLVSDAIDSSGSLIDQGVNWNLDKQRENFDRFGVDLATSTRGAGQGAASNLSGGLLDGQPEISAASQAIGQAIPQDAAQAVIANSGVMENAGKAVVGPLSQGVEESKGGFLSAIGNLLSAAAKKVSEFFSGLKKSSANTVASATSAQSRSAAPASVQRSAAPARDVPVAARSRIMAMPTPPSGPLDVETIAARVGSASAYAAQQAQQITMAVQAASGPQSVKVELPKMQQPVVNEYHTYNITGNVKDWKDLETLQQICQRERGRKQAIRKGISMRG